MKLYLNECVNNLKEEEREIYSNDTATNYFRYIQNTDKYKEVMGKFYNKKNISKDDWCYIFEKLYLTTYKSLCEEEKIHLSDRFTLIMSKFGMTISPYKSLEYYESSRCFEIIRSFYRNREIDDCLLKALDILMQEYDIDALIDLIKMHEEACIFRNNRDYFYKLYGEAKPGVISHSEHDAINSLNRSYEREKKNINNYKVLINRL